MAYCTGLQLLERYDARRIAELVSDTGSRVNIVGLDLNPNLIAALEDASAEIDAAVFVGKRYTRERLLTLIVTSSSGGLIHSGGYFLIRLTADLAFGILNSRRGLAATESSQLAPRYEQALGMLQQLRSGERIFNIPDELNAEAGLAKTVNFLDLQNDNTYVTSSYRYFGNLPNNNYGGGP